MRDIPTFRDNRDRAVYLLAEFKVPLSITVLAAGVWLAYIRPELPTPPEDVRYVAASWALLALPTFWFGRALVRWIYEPDTVRVGVANGGETDVYTGFEVPPETWAKAEIEGDNPHRPEEGFDFVVSEFEWYGDTETLTVRGMPRSGMEPWEQWQCKERIDEYHENHQTLRRKYAKLKALFKDKATAIHDLTIMQMLETTENAELATDTTITDIIEDMEREADGLPDEPSAEWKEEAIIQQDGPEIEFDEDRPEPVATDGGPENE